MNERIKKLWVEVLRSGKYPQGRGKLVRVMGGEPVGFCCLGVLCELAVGEGVAEWHDDVIVSKDEGKVHREAHYLPPAVQKWAGIEAGNPEVPVNNTLRYPLGALNDGLYGDHAWTFEEIADAIERSL
jgi:hypothetical protein